MAIKKFRPVDFLLKLPPADEEGRVKIWSSYTNVLNPEKRSLGGEIEQVIYGLRSE